MIVDSNRNNIHMIEGIRILPGSNYLTESQSVAVAKSEAFEVQKKQGFMSVVEDSVDTGESPSEALAEMTIADAKRLVKKTFDITVLRQILKEESRKTIKRAAQKQIDMILEEREGKSDNSELTEEDL